MQGNGCVSKGSELFIIWEFPKIGDPYFGVVIIGILPFRVLHRVPHFRKLPYQYLEVPFWGSCIGSYKGIPKRNYYGAYGYIEFMVEWSQGFRVWLFGIRALTVSLQRSKRAGNTCEGKAAAGAQKQSKVPEGHRHRGCQLKH